MSRYQAFKERATFRIEISLVITLFLLIIVIYALPKFDRKINLEQEPIIEFIQSEEIPQIELQKMQAPMQRPSIPVLSENEEISEDFTIEDMDFDDYEAIDAPPPPPKDSESGVVIEFIMYEEPPSAIGGPSAIAKNIVYPDIAREAGIEGKIVVQTFVDKKGIVQHCMILSGMPGTGLDEAAMAAIKKTRFKPAKQRDRDVGVWIAIPVTFSLKSS